MLGVLEAALGVLVGGCGPYGVHALVSFGSFSDVVLVAGLGNRPYSPMSGTGPGGGRRPATIRAVLTERVPSRSPAFTSPAAKSAS